MKKKKKTNRSKYASLADTNSLDKSVVREDNVKLDYYERCVVGGGGTFVQGHYVMCIAFFFLGLSLMCNGFDDDDGDDERFFLFNDYVGVFGRVGGVLVEVF